MSVRVQITKNVPNWSQNWRFGSENWSKSIPGPLRSVSDQSRDQKKQKNSGRAALGLSLEPFGVLPQELVALCHMQSCLGVGPKEEGQNATTTGPWHGSVLVNVTADCQYHRRVTPSGGRRQDMDTLTRRGLARHGPASKDTGPI